MSRIIKKKNYTGNLETGHLYKNTILVMYKIELYWSYQAPVVQVACVDVEFLKKSQDFS